MIEGDKANAQGEVYPRPFYLFSKVNITERHLGFVMQESASSEKNHPLIMVPAPSSVKTSWSRALRFEPLMMWALLTPRLIR
jgi:hypothetical protein